MKAWKLTVVNGMAIGTELVIHGRSRILVGRSHSADLRLADPFVSRRHIELFVTHEGAWLHDVSGREGSVWLNGNKVSSENGVAISIGDIVTICTGQSIGDRFVKIRIDQIPIGSFDDESFISPTCAVASIPPELFVSCEDLEDEPGCCTYSTSATTGDAETKCADVVEMCTRSADMAEIVHMRCMKRPNSARHMLMSALMLPIILPIAGCGIVWAGIKEAQASIRALWKRKNRRLVRINQAVAISNNESGDSIGIAVVAPSVVCRHEDVMIQIVGDVEKLLDDAVEAAKKFDLENDASLRGKLVLDNVQQGTILTFELQIPDLTVEENILQCRWNGSSFSLQFFAHVDSDCHVGIHRAKVLVFANERPVGRIGFVVNIAVERLQRRNNAKTEAHGFKHYFISYSDKDFDLVLSRLQGLQLVDCNFDKHSFFDKLFLKPGERYETLIFDYIDNKADVFLLFWSKNAAVSEWVKKEYKRALQRQTTKDGLPDIVPVPIENPPPLPPVELAHLHFSDITSQIRRGR